MTNIVQLEIPSAAANRHTVELLEEALEEARAGKIQEVAMAVVYSEGGSGWRHSSSPDLATLIGAAAILSHKLLLETD